MTPAPPWGGDTARSHGACARPLWDRPGTVCTYLPSNSPDEALLRGCAGACQPTCPSRRLRQAAAPLPLARGDLTCSWWGLSAPVSPVPPGAYLSVPSLSPAALLRSPVCISLRLTSALPASQRLRLPLRVPFAEGREHHRCTTVHLRDPSILRPLPVPSTAPGHRRTLPLPWRALGQLSPCENAHLTADMKGKSKVPPRSTRRLDPDSLRVGRGLLGVLKALTMRPLKSHSLDFTKMQDSPPRDAGRK